MSLRDEDDMHNDRNLENNFGFLVLGVLVELIIFTIKNLLEPNWICIYRYVQVFQIV